MTAARTERTTTKRKKKYSFLPQTPDSLTRKGEKKKKKSNKRTVQQPGDNARALPFVVASMIFDNYNPHEWIQLDNEKCSLGFFLCLFFFFFL